MSHAKYSLPGLRNACDKRALAASIIFAYSRVTNPRRLEAPFYDFWNRVFTALLYDIEYALSVPQNTIYAPSKVKQNSAAEPSNPGDLTAERPAADSSADSDPNTVEPSNPEDSTTDSLTPKNPEVAVSTSERPAADSPADSDPNISGMTDYLPKGSKVRHPDFGLVVSSFLDRLSREDASPSTIYRLWHTLTVNYGGPIGFGEIKRPPSRSSATVDIFWKDLKTNMRLAQRDLQEDVDLVFSTNIYKLDKYVLIAAVGEWWTFKFASRPREDAPVRKPKATWFLDYLSKTSTAKNTVDYDIPDDHVFRRYDDVPYMATPETNIRDALPRSRKWSDLILFGTPASNQRLYLINQELKRLADILCSGEMHSEPVVSDSEEDSSTESDEAEDEEDKEESEPEETDEEDPDWVEGDEEASDGEESDD